MINFSEFLNGNAFFDCYENQIRALAMRNFRCEEDKCSAKDATIEDIRYYKDENKICVFMRCNKCKRRYKYILVMHENFENLVNLHLETLKELNKSPSLVDSFFYALQYSKATCTPLPA